MAGGRRRRGRLAGPPATARFAASFCVGPGRAGNRFRGLGRAGCPHAPGVHAAARRPPATPRAAAILLPGSCSDQYVEPAGQDRSGQGRAGFQLNGSSQAAALGLAVGQALSGDRTGIWGSDPHEYREYS